MDQWEHFLRSAGNPLNQGEIRRLYTAALKERGEQYHNSSVSPFTLWFFDAARADPDSPVIFKLHEIEDLDPQCKELCRPLWALLKSGLGRKDTVRLLRALSIKEERDYLAASILIQLVFLFPSSHSNKHKAQSTFCC